MSNLGLAIIFLTAAVIAVPFFTRLKLGSILGYLAAGIIIGPSVLGLISEPDQILHFAEYGVVFLLFIIGLELDPQKLWRMRNDILFIGGGQLLISTVVIFAAVFWLLNDGFKVPLIVGMALALSSTAFAIQLMTEKRILNTELGQKGFSILLMQDIAVIPILLLVEALAGRSNPDAPAWWVSIAAIVLVLLSGKYFVNPFLRTMSRYGSSEVITASALLIVMATALLMHNVGLSMGMGAFTAGILLANSSFRHQMEVEISPFKGLLLGLFFIAVGMKLDLALLVSDPFVIVSGALALMAAKMAIIYLLIRKTAGLRRKKFKLALMLSQGGEFAFVIMSFALSQGVIERDINNMVTIIVSLSMALTSPLILLVDKVLQRSGVAQNYDQENVSHEPEVIIAGFGRFGQITGRILTANHIRFTALDYNAEHIEFVRQFGNKVFFGDATNLKLLRAAGLEHAKVMFIAADSDKHGFAIAKTVREHYPNLKIVARAKSRLSVLKYREMGVETTIREMFDGSLKAAQIVLEEYGIDEGRAEFLVKVFRRHDEEMLEQAYRANDRYDFEEVLKVNKKGREELESLFNSDKLD
ncbi:monovalent cation:proton antiporter-2 (CPA2) family protein [Thalassotalea sp. PS06]|uniref:monovalent cation:proton antiporter-2 (CPA2) family protein n=1 Tax=Thalassotalea sp. PS06 TaxID=2594005 RepID=UPI0011628FFF|nr:monovalent cation:proton antiporter-2 (CPA2) family protein [Thalassotalea sp. PS06]QDP02698.1 potassium transporter [Thalassotalea sp. PS06]